MVITVQQFFAAENRKICDRFVAKKCQICSHNYNNMKELKTSLKC